MPAPLNAPPAPIAAPAAAPIAAPAAAPLATTPAGGRRRWRDLAPTLAALALLLAWDASGLDLAAARLFGDAAGFAWRDAWLTRTLVHDGGRLLGWAVFIALAAQALGQRWRRPGAQTPRRGPDRWRWLAATLACLLVVPAIKRISLTSCPWDLREFGGVAVHVSHWLPGIADGGSGHCFPSGHAVAAFAFFTLYFQWRDLDPARARRWLVAVLACGAAFGLAQLARGAHYPSHTLWSAWICWTLCALADRWPAGPVSRARGRGCG